MPRSHAPRRPARLLAALLAPLAPALAAGVAHAGPVDLPRHPAISPDGGEIVFTWRGDLFRVDAEGGEALRLTAHRADDLHPRWTPDGEHVVFQSDRDGNANIWVMRRDGSELRQVTDLDRGLAPYDVAEIDGEVHVLLHANMEGDVYRDNRPYAVPLAGGPIVRLHDAFGSRPTLSPDGSRLLFTRGGYYDGWERRHYRGAENADLWIHDRRSGDFRRITDWAGNDGKGRWGADNLIYFLSDREDRTVNLYRHDVDRGVGRPRRMTNFDGRDIHDWDLSDDGDTAVLMSWDTLYLLDVSRNNPRPRAIEITAASDARDDVELMRLDRVSEAQLSPDGKTLAVVAYGEVFVRSVADDGAPTRRVTESAARESGIAWSPDGLKLYFSSDDGEDGHERIHAATVRTTRTELKEAVSPPKEDEADEAAPADEPAAPAAPADPISGTWEGTADVPGMGVIPFTMTLAYEDGQVNGSITAGPFNGGISGTFDPSSGRIDLVVTLEDGTVLNMTGRLEDGRLSGEVETADGVAELEGGRTGMPDAGNEPADDDGDADEKKDDAPKDPKLDPARWQDAIAFDLEVVVDADAPARDPLPSPDGRHLAFRQVRGDWSVMDLDAGEIRPLLRHWDARSEVVWSPDARWIAYAQSDLDFNRDIWIMPADGSAEAVNVTRHPDNDASPRWSLDGRRLAFVSERTGEEYDVWAVQLDADLDDLAEVDLEAYEETQVKKAKGRKPLAPRDPDDEDEADEDEADAPAFDLELDDAYLRVRRVTRLDGNEGNVQLTPGGDRIVFSGSGAYGGLHSVKWDGSDRKSLGGGGRVVQMSLDGGTLLLISGGRATTVSPTGGGRKVHPTSATITVDLREQSSQKFLEAARRLGEEYYHPTMNGLDWPEVTAAYHELALGARTADEFNWVANRFIGELNGSHLSIRARGESSPLRQSHGRLGTFHERVDDGFRVTAIVPDSPADAEEMGLRVGDVITAIDFEPFAATDTLESALKGHVGRETVVSVVRTETGDDEEETVRELDLLMTPTSSGGITNLRYEAWRNENARLVDELSNGRLGYIHIRGMSQPSLDVFERDLFAACEGKDGLVLDVRNNGGGWTTDRVLSSIMVQPHAYTVPRGADWSRTGHYPQDRLFIQRYSLPMNLLCNEKSYSNAEIISHAFKTLDRGTLVGMPTHGSVISTGGFSLIDGTFVRLPFRGWFVADGTGRDMELNGAEPDLIVPQLPGDESEGVDVQLRTAVEDLLERLDD